MKKIILLFSVIALTLSSCSDDDSSSSLDQLIGTWKYSMELENGTEIPLEDCESLDTFEVLSNGNYVSRFHNQDTNENCIQDDNSTGTWENVGSGFYSTTETGGTAVVAEIHFSGNTFYYEEIKNGVTYKTVFIRQ